MNSNPNANAMFQSPKSAVAARPPLHLNSDFGLCILCSACIHAHVRCGQSNSDISTAVTTFQARLHEAGRSTVHGYHEGCWGRMRTLYIHMRVSRSWRVGKSVVRWMDGGGTRMTRDALGRWWLRYATAYVRFWRWMDWAGTWWACRIEVWGREGKGG